MDVVNSIANPATGPVAQTAATPSANSSITGDFETFLTLLTAQLRNQDPSEPVDSTQYVAQLASFSAVEQQVATNTQLAELVSIMGDGDLKGLASWIGTEIRVNAPALFDGQSLEIHLQPVSGADKAMVEIRNDFGQVVATKTIDPSAADFQWDGLTGTGETAPTGRYSFEASYFSGDTLLGSAPGQTYSAVTEILIEDKTPKLVTESGARFSFDEVGGVRGVANDGI